MRRLALAALAVCALLAVPLAAEAGAKVVWVCKPGLKKNPCTESLTTTVIGETEDDRTIERTKVAKDPPVDCFYVYPTVSGQQTANANQRIDPEQRAIAKFQAGRFSSMCRVFAPIYRQLTLLGILDRDNITPAQRAIAYNSAREAWREYLRKYNKGRGVIFISHSQGTFVLRELIAKEVERGAAADRLISALLLGGNVQVAKGRDVGGDFKAVRACRSARQIGCVVAYSMYIERPPENSLFGRVAESDRDRLEVLCTNPASLSGDRGRLHAYIPRQRFPGVLGTLVQAQSGPLPEFSTPWLAQKESYKARCSSAGGANVLDVDPIGDAAPLTPQPDPSWGLHLADVNLAVGNLVTLASKQAAAWLRARGTGFQR